MMLYADEMLQEIQASFPEYLVRVHGVSDLNKPFSCMHPNHPADVEPTMIYSSQSNTVQCKCGACGDIFEMAGWDTGTTEFDVKVEVAAAGAGVPLGDNPVSADPILGNPIPTVVPKVIEAENRGSDVDVRRYLGQVLRDAKDGKASNNGQVLPYIIPFDMDKIPPRAPELIEGVLRVGENLIIASHSKGYKTWNTMGLAISVATGTEWLGFKCKAGRVLYLNGELTEPSCLNRLNDICRARCISADEIRGKIDVMQARGGCVAGFSQLVDAILTEIPCGYYLLVVIDPIYIFMTGEENLGGDVRGFLNEVTRLGNGLGCSIVFVHHHSKGAQGDKSSIDRMSGSGVFGRWCDAVLDFTPLAYNSEEEGVATLDGTARPYRVELSLRDFKGVETFDTWFRFPQFIRDYKGLLNDLSLDSDSTRGAKKRGQQIHKDAAKKWEAKEAAIVAEIVATPGRMITKARALEISGYNDDHTLRKWVEGDKKTRTPPSKLLKVYNPTRNSSYLILRGFDELISEDDADDSTSDQ